MHCRNCHTDNPPGAAFCNACGARLKSDPYTTGIGASGNGSLQAPGLERRTVTIMFCDLVGSTAMSTRLDPEDLGNVLVSYRELCAEAVRQFGGTVTRYVGDGLLICFGYPAAHDNDAVRAVRAALQIRSDIEQRGTRAEGDAVSGLSVHIGIHTGEVVVGELGSGSLREHSALVGETPNIAARLQSEAGPGDVVIGPSTYRLVLGAVACEAMPPLKLKGIEQPMTAYRVLGMLDESTGLPSLPAHRSTDLIGRDEELQLLTRRWERVLRGAGQVVLLSGEPGIGKTRLLQSLSERFGLGPDEQVTCQCSPYFLNSAFFPFIETIRRKLGLRTKPTRDAVLEALQTAVGSGALPRSDDLNLVAAVVAGIPLGETVTPELSPQAQRERFMEWLADWLAESRVPRMLVVEDAHWADASTLDFLSLLIERVPLRPVFVVLSFRPDLRIPWPVRSHVLHLTLGRLSTEDASALVDRLTEGRRLPQSVLQQILARSDGVPLFVEEITKMVMEAGALDPDAGDARDSQRSRQINIPDTLRGSLLARLDKLEAAKVVAQIAAVIDREISFKLLGILSGLDEQTLRTHLKSLVSAELLLQRGAPPESTYIFKHSLIRDAAYHTLLKASRAQYHRQTAEVLLSRFPALAESHPEFVAYHFSKAGLGERAFEYWRLAGLRALEGSANLEATAHLRAALKELSSLPTGTDPAREVELRISLGTALTAVRGYGSSEVADAYARAFVLCENLGDDQRLFAALTGLHSYYQVRGPMQRAREVAERLLALAVRSRDESQLAQAHRRLGWSLFCSGNMSEGKKHLDTALGLYDATRSRQHSIVYGAHPWIVGFANAAWVEWVAGHPNVARRRSESAIALARELGRPLPLAYALCMSAAMHQCLDEPKDTLKLATETVALARDNGMPYWIAWGSVLEGWALARTGDLQPGLLRLQRGLDAYRDTGAELFRPHCLCLLAEVLHSGGRASEALDILSEALSSANEQGVHFYTSEIHRLSGTLLCESGTDNDRAETEFRAAVELAQQQHASAFERRALIGLMSLLLRAGRRTEAELIAADLKQRFPVHTAAAAGGGPGRVGTSAQPH